MIKHIFIVLAFFGTSVARKGGKGRTRVLDLSDVVNPDPAATEPASPAEYNADRFLGDIVTDVDANSDDRNAVADKTKLWPEAIVPYVLDKSVSDAMLKIIAKAIADFHKHTCVKIVPKINERDYVKIHSKNGQGCFAMSIGKKNGETMVNLEGESKQGPNCQLKGTVIHEFLHVLGFAHEQNRGDRKNHVEIIWDNIKNRRAQQQFEILAAEEEDTQGLSYDFSSVMHYGERAFGKYESNGTHYVPQITIKTVDRSNQNKIGQRAGFSKQDIKEVNKLYKCKGKKSSVGGDIVRE